MKTTIISVKQLRQKFEMVRESLAAGHSFTLVYRSQPFATLQPMDNQLDQPELRRERIKNNLEKLEKIAGGLKLGRGRTPSQMNKDYEKSYEKLLS